MDINCDLCLVNNISGEISIVKETIINLNPGYQPLINIIKGIFGCPVRYLRNIFYNQSLQFNYF